MERNSDFIPERVRAQLLALGIPAAKHTAPALGGLFPREFNIGATGLDTEDVAKVLVDLAGRGIITVADAGARTSIKQVKPGWHFCQFYRNFDQLLDLTAPYIAEGLKNGEGCLWVLPEAVTHKAACDAIAESVEDIDGYLASGQLEMLPHPLWYLDPAGRLKTFEQISGALLAKQDQALARGFKFLRAAGDTGWVSGTEESKAFIEYEMKVNAALGATQVAAVRTYRADVTADEFVAIVTAHQDALSNAPAP
ncbi:MAG TPA: MEDS domain-containing protein [Polyangia bacterium]